MLEFTFSQFENKSENREKQTKSHLPASGEHLANNAGVGNKNDFEIGLILNFPRGAGGRRKNPIQSGHLPSQSDEWKAKSLKLDYGILLTFPPEIALCVRQAASSKDLGAKRIHIYIYTYNYIYIGEVQTW
ncbi:uncharacterized protein LOC122611793 [Drosophila teissieri]|uniref:uncharacterized protein LOC122611793 n=1 Tax=Drosophila teissieri TaxID=7243 RepID=UPI001CBA3045|nr:uncharacterized protein LOC122611793 [Drosophila teissieri]